MINQAYFFRLFSSGNVQFIHGVSNSIKVFFVRHVGGGNGRHALQVSHTKSKSLMQCKAILCFGYEMSISQIINVNIMLVYCRSKFSLRPY